MKQINGEQLKKALLSGANNLNNHKDLIDKLNVFPVPDGDTGTNMSLTMNSAVKEIESVRDVNVTNIIKAASKGSLMGARGNSGVILSQLLRGIAKALQEKESIFVEDMALALDSASKMAYNAVMRPIEGTILTVARETGEFAIKISKEENDLIEFMAQVIKKANSSLQRTPDLLPSLKEAGVVDSGGKGLLTIYEGIYASLKGNDIKRIDNQGYSEELNTYASVDIDVENLKFCYCTEYVLKSNQSCKQKIHDEIYLMGDSMVLVEDEDLIKVHIHTNEPDKILSIALNYGELVKVKVENMKIQHEHHMQYNEGNDTKVEKQVQIQEESDYGVIAVSVGEGINKIFEDFGVDVIIQGGQTMNPSTEDFISAIEKINAKEIIIFPNNSNIIMAANQAKSISEKSVHVIETKNVPQSFAALVGLDKDSTIEENLQNMNFAIKSVKSGQVTYAVRDTQMNGTEVKSGDIISIFKGEIKEAGNNVPKVTEDLIKSMVTDEDSIISLFYGEDVSKQEAEKLKNRLEEIYQDLDIEVYYGGQPLYYYLVSVE